MPTHIMGNNRAFIKAQEQKRSQLFRFARDFSILFLSGLYGGKKIAQQP